MSLFTTKDYIFNLIRIILIYSISNNCVFAQSFNTNLRFVKYSTAMGLSSNAQKCFAQDKEGFIWIGTFDGLNRFDGYKFKVYRNNPNNHSSLRSNMINCLFIDSKGILWIGTTGGGLSKYNKEKDNFYNYTLNLNDSTSLLNNDVTCILEDKYHQIWVGTMTGLHLFDPDINGFRYFVAGNKLSSKTITQNSISTLALDNNILWISTGGILTAMDTKNFSFKHYDLFDVPSHQIGVFSMNYLVVDKNKIWISTWSKGIYIFDKLTGKCSPYENETSKYINFIFKDNKNQIWYSPESKGLYLLNSSGKTIFQYNDYDRYSLSSNSLYGIFQDNQNNIWLASKQADVNYLILNNPFNTWYKNPNSVYGLTNILITTVLEDSKKRIWLGYQDGGIDILDAHGKKNRIHIKGDHSTGLGPGTITYIFESRNGTIWVSKYLDGLKKFNESSHSFSSFTHREDDPESIAGNDVRHITEDKKGNLWLAIHGGGIDRFDPSTGKFFHHKHDENNPSASIKNDWTYTAEIDDEENVWVGSIDGVSMISSKSAIVKHYQANSKNEYSLSNKITKIINAKSKDYIWIGTNDGLNRLDRRTNKIKKYFTTHGLSNNVITDIHEDAHGNLWIGTAKGLSKFSPNKETFKNYSVQDGLITDEFNTFSSCKTRDGEMYFGGREGLNCFHPDKITINYFKPPVYITDFKLFNQSVDVEDENIPAEFSLPNQISYCDEITLEYHQNVITLEFAALNFLNLEKNQYKYRLEGFEENWNLPTFKRDVTYTNLHPGKYTFRVIAANNDGIWNNVGASLKIIVNPPFWRTKIAYVFYAIMIVGMLYIFRKWILHEAEIKRKLALEELEIHKLQEMDTLKMQFFSNVSHEFRTPLSLIIGPIEKLLKNVKDEAEQIQLKLVHRNVNRLLRLINQLMDFRKIEESKLELNLTKNDIILFVKEIIGAFEQDAKQRNIKLNFEHTYPAFEIWFDTDKLDKIIFNLLSNAFKYTPDNGCIDVTINLNNHTEKSFKITVKDSGIGIPKEAQAKIFDRFYQVKNSVTTQGTGIGLSLAYELVKLHNGIITVESEINQGSEFTVTLPLWINENELPNFPSAQKIAETGITKNIVIDEQPLQSSKEQAKINDKQPSLLVIEDNADMRLFVKNEFIDCYSVSEAHNGSVGLQKAFDEIPDAIICDIMMPGMNGLEVCKTLKHDERTSHIPIIMLTAKSSEQHTIEGFESGADDYITKPFSSAVLKVRTKNLIESRILLRKKFVKEPFASIKEISPSKVDEKLFDKAYAIVEKNLNNPDFEVNDLAHEIGMSRTQLYRKINAISGQSVKEFIRIIRLKKAAEMLVTTDNNISEVAFAVGFNSLSYFTTSFTEYFGMNPTKYIEKYIK